MGDDPETGVNDTDRLVHDDGVYELEQYRRVALIERGQLLGRLLALVSALIGGVVWLIYRFFFGETVPVFEK